MINSVWKCRINSQRVGEVELGGINPAMKRHLEQEIMTLQNAPRSRKTQAAFENNAKTKGGSYAHRRHRKAGY